MTTTNIPKRSPWGKVQDAWVKGEGIVSVSCAGHGGVKVSAKQNKRIPESVRKADGWYEEDVEWAIVALCFPEAYPDPEHQKQAKCTVADYYPEALEQLTGEKPTLANSRKLREEEFKKTTNDKFVVKTAWGLLPGIPAGKVKTLAVRKSDNLSQYYLVDTEDYYRQSVFGYVITEKDIPIDSD
jgi:hypothetical protein